MPIRLVPLDSNSFTRWAETSSREYAADLVSLGASSAEARSQAEASLRDSFPEGRTDAENAVFNLIDDAGVGVGYIWVGRDRSDDPTSWWVWDILVVYENRGKGYGREGMKLAEEYARSRGATTLGLNVFGFNQSARSLYESLGYETRSVKMRKSLAPD